jgi:hypothetical protein
VLLTDDGFAFATFTTPAQVIVDLRKALLSQVWDDVKTVLMKAASMPYNSEEISLANEEVRPHQSERERE